MNGFQMFLALGAMMLLSLVIMNVNKNSLLTEDVMYDSNFGITATSIASSIIEDASKKRFDSIFYIDSSTVKIASSFTSVSDLGIETGEDINDPKTFNDFDDYHGFSTVDTTMAKQTAIFNVSCQVNYVNEDDLDGTAASQTFHKKITVKVWSRSMKDTVVISSVFSYWNFLP